LSAHRARFTYFYVALALHDHYRSQYQTKSDGLLGFRFLHARGTAVARPVRPCSIAGFCERIP